MQKIKERRKEKRLYIEIPVRFAEETDGTFLQALMVDISSIGMAFICEADMNCPSVNQNLTMQFSILRIDDLNGGRHRVAVKFDNPPFWNLPPESDR
jgi:hypothetical protein